MYGQQARRQKSAPPLFRRRTLKNEEEKPVRTAFPYRWVICACGLVTIFISIGLVSNVFSIYLPYIVQQNGFTNTQTGLLTTMRTVTALLSMLGADGYYRRFGLRRGLTLPFLATVAAYLLYGSTRTPAFYYGAAVLTGLGYGLGGIFPVALLIRAWFPKKAATAMSIAATGSGIASLLGPITVTRWVNAYGLSGSFFREAWLILALAGMVLLLVRDGPPPLAPQAPKEQTPAQSAPGGGAGGLPRPVQAVMVGVCALIGTLGITAFSSLPLLYTTAGMPMETAAACLSPLGLFLMGGQLLYGRLADHAGHRAAALNASAAMAAGLALCCLANRAGPGLMLAALVLLGGGMALSTVAFSVFAADFSAPGQYAAVLKRYQAAYSVGGLLSGVVPGMLADATGSYVPVFAGFLLLSGVIGACLAGVYRRYGGPAA